VLVEPVGKFHDYQKSRITDYKWQYWDGKAWVDLASGNTPSRVQIHAIPKVKAERVRLFFHNDPKQNTAHIAELGIYNEPR